MVTTGRPHSCASAIPRRIVRSPPTVSGSPDRRSVVAATTTGIPSRRPRATSAPWASSPVIVPGMTTVSDRWPARNCVGIDAFGVTGVLDVVPELGSGLRAAGHPRGRDVPDGRVHCRGVHDPVRPETQDRRPTLAQLIPGHDRVDQPPGQQVLGGLDPLREHLAGDGGEGAGAEEADHRARLGRRDVPRRAQRGQDAARRWTAQVHEIGQPRGTMLGQRCCDRDHLDEGRGTLLHPGPTGTRHCHQWQSLFGRPPDCRHNSRGRSHPHRSAEESELPGQDGGANPTNSGISGQNGLIRSRRDKGGLQLPGIGLRQWVESGECAIPSAERVGVG